MPEDGERHPWATVCFVTGAALVVAGAWRRAVTHDSLGWILMLGGVLGQPMPWARRQIA